MTSVDEIRVPWTLRGDDFALLVLAPGETWLPVE
jgi:hypothetical protein